MQFSRLYLYLFIFRIKYDNKISPIFLTFYIATSRERTGIFERDEYFLHFFELIFECSSIRADRDRTLETGDNRTFVDIWSGLKSGAMEK